MPERNGKPCLEQGLSHQTIGPFVNKRIINVIVETPKGKRNKLKFDERWQCFRLGKVLPAGATFPFDFGFIPGTRADDGDPLDVLLLMDESTYPGCLVAARPIGIIEAEQSERRRAVRNDRILAVAVESHDHRRTRTLKDLGPQLLHELERFFQSYNETEGKEFRLLHTRGPERALAAIKRSLR